MEPPSPLPTVHLLCNAHLDPVWLWEWPEGAGEALALARTVCDLCEEFEGFVFNRNEVQFYEWIEEYDSPLFRRIAELVARGAWHVMGGWYLQPDCNLPSGESFVRQILVGKTYFRKKFGAEPTTAVNVDSGHSRGLVQILARSGYDSYLFCRPKPHESSLPAPEFTWVGFGGSEVTAAVAESHYNSAPGRTVEKIREWMERDGEKVVRQLPWGVGNHGGGPSRRDLADISAFVAAKPDLRILHSTPEAYFADLRGGNAPLPLHAEELNPWAVGCYTSGMALKQRHRRLEDALLRAEKMASTAWAQGLMAYPKEELADATRSLLANQFHDILGGTSIPSAEATALDELGHGLTLARRVETRAFFALSAGQAPGKEGSHSILVFNPHPFPLRTRVACEVQPYWPDRPLEHGVPEVLQGKTTVPAQAEQEESNINEDHRKRVVFEATLKPGRMNRFDCRFRKVRRKPAPRVRIREGVVRFRNPDLEVVLNARTGLLNRYRVNGKDFLTSGSFRPLVMKDDPNPWGMMVKGFREKEGAFRLMNQTRAARFAGVPEGRLSPVRVIEDGPVRTVVEALLAFEGSAICQRYLLPKEGTEVEVETRVLWQEKDRMLKLSVPTVWRAGRALGEVAYGVQEYDPGEAERVAQKWLAVLDDTGEEALTLINDSTYGFDFLGGELRPSLVRGTAHSAHPTDTGRPILKEDRFTPRMDQREHLFRFWLNGGKARVRLAAVGREAMVHNQPPVALAYWPSGTGQAPKAGPVLSDRAVQVTAFKKAEEGEDLIVRLFEPTGRARTTTLTLEAVGLTARLRLSPFEIRTLRIDPGRGEVRDVDLLERP